MERAIVPNGATEALRADDYRALVTHLPAISYIEDPEGNDLFVSPEIEVLLGYTVDEWMAVPRKWVEVIHPDDMDRVIEADRLAAEPGDAFALEYRMITKDGRVVWVRDVARPQLDASGRVIRWHGVMLDLTELHQAEDRADHAERAFRTMVERSPVTLYVEHKTFGQSDRSAYLGPKVTALSGYAVHELRADGNLWMSRIHPDDVGYVRSEDERTDLTGDVWDVEYRFLTKDDRAIWIHDHAELVEGEPGGPMVWHGYLMDITHIKEVEADLQSTIEMLHRADSHRRQLYSRLVSIQEEERAQIAREIHDDPVQKMTALALRLQLLDSVLEDEAQRERLRDTLEVVGLTTKSLRRLLFDLSPPALERDGLAAAVRDYAVRHAEDDDGRISVADLLPFETPLPVRVTAFQVIREALTNARKHARAAEVEVLLEARDRGLQVTVRDDGQGFDPSAVAWQAGHVGLGSMRDRAELAGGQVEIRSAPGEGTTVVLWLPVDRDSGDPPS